MNILIKPKAKKIKIKIAFHFDFPLLVQLDARKLGDVY